MELFTYDNIVNGVCIVFMIMVVLAAKHERGFAAAASFGGLVLVVVLRYYRRALCNADEVLVWKFCVPESQVTPLF